MVGFIFYLAQIAIFDLAKNIPVLSGINGSANTDANYKVEIILGILLNHKNLGCTIEREEAPLVWSPGQFLRYYNVRKRTFAWRCLNNDVHTDDAGMGCGAECAFRKTAKLFCAYTV